MRVSHVNKPLRHWKYTLSKPNGLRQQFLPTTCTKSWDSTLEVECCACCEMRKVMSGRPGLLPLDWYTDSQIWSRLWTGLATSTGLSVLADRRVRLSMRVHLGSTTHFLVDGLAASSSNSISTEYRNSYLLRGTNTGQLFLGRRS